MSVLDHPRKMLWSIGINYSKHLGQLSQLCSRFESMGGIVRGRYGPAAALPIYGKEQEKVAYL